MYFLLIALPLLSFLVLNYLGNLLNRVNFMVVSLFCIGITVVLALIVFIEVSFLGNVCYLSLLSWFNVGLLEVNWSLAFDNLTVVMLLIILAISFFVHVYSCEYIFNDLNLGGFLAYLSLFTFIILLLVTSDNMLVLFFGWEGVGLASYLLISFWNTRHYASQASLKAMLVNRVGDVGVVVALMVSFFLIRTLDFGMMRSLFIISNLYFFKYVCFFLIIGLMGKSAQLGLHIWLPDAIEGPTPVSALLHAATIVTAGVFLIVRFSFLFEFNKSSLNVLVVLGAITLLFAASCGLVQTDVKRVIAYSTCSQLGYMVFSCGLSNYNVALFHLFNHAFFKALLFLSAGSIIHACSDEQDLRKIGGLLRLLPLTYVSMLIGSLALIGFPFIAGYYSKDLILELSYVNLVFFSKGLFGLLMGLISVAFTAFYSVKLLILVFLKKVSGFKVNYNIVTESGVFMVFPLVILSVLSIVVGFMCKDFFVGLGSFFWKDVLIQLSDYFFLLEVEDLGFFKILPFLVMMVGVFVSVLFYYYQFNVNYFLSRFLFLRFLFLMVLKRYFFDIFIQTYLLKYIFFFGYEVGFKLLDKSFFNFLEVDLLLNVTLNKMFTVSMVQTGYYYDYAFVAFVILLLSIFLSFIYSYVGLVFLKVLWFFIVLILIV